MSDNRLLRIKNMKGKLCFFVLKSAIQRGPRANLAWLRYVLVFAFESGQTANLERVGSILLFANQSGPRAILERLGCVLLFANQGGPRAKLKRLGSVRMFATKSRPKGNICVGGFFSENSRKLFTNENHIEIKSRFMLCLEKGRNRIFLPGDNERFSTTT